MVKAVRERNEERVGVVGDELARRTLKKLLDQRNQLAKELHDIDNQIEILCYVLGLTVLR